MILTIEKFLENPYLLTKEDTKVISVAGGSGSGKSYFSKKLADKLGFQVIKLDDYIIPSTITKTSNWDLPHCWDLKRVKLDIEKFYSGKPFEKPKYNFKSGHNLFTQTVYPTKNIILEGLYALHPDIYSLSDLKIFIDVDKKERLQRVIKRDVIERGNKTEEKIINRWIETVQPTYVKLVELQKQKADVILVDRLNSS
jgi:uridine kinase